MTKCDFCEQQSPCGKCVLRDSYQATRVPHCRRAIKRMQSAMKNCKGNGCCNLICGTKGKEV